MTCMLSLSSFGVNIIVFLVLWRWRLCCCAYAASSVREVWRRSRQLCLQHPRTAWAPLSEAGYGYAQQNSQRKVQRNEAWMNSFSHTIHLDCLWGTESVKFNWIVKLVVCIFAHGSFMLVEDYLMHARERERESSCAVNCWISACGEKHKFVIMKIEAAISII